MLGPAHGSTLPFAAGPGGGPIGRKPGTARCGAWYSDRFRGITTSVEKSPSELSGRGDEHCRVRDASSRPTPPPSVEPFLSSIGDGNDPGRLAFAASLEGLTQGGVMAVMLRYGGITPR